MLQIKTTPQQNMSSKYQNWNIFVTTGQNVPKFKNALNEDKVFKYFKWRRPPMEDDLKILKVEYLSNLLLDHT